MSKAISIRIQPHTGRQAGGQRRHDLRDPRHMPDYVDQSRTERNSVLIEPPDPASLRAEIAEHRAAAGQQKLRADARTSIAGIVTFGTEAQPVVEALTIEQQDALFRRVAERVSKEADRPLLGLVVHRDESAVHAHFTLRGYKFEDGKEIAPRLGRKDLQRLQDAAAQEVAHLGIERGVSRAIREARGDDKAKVVHRSVKELHEALPREIEALEATAEIARQKAEKNRELAEKARADLEAHKGDEEKVLKRLDVYERRKASAMAEIGRALDALYDGMVALGIIDKDAPGRVEALQMLRGGDPNRAMQTAVSAAIQFRDEIAPVAREQARERSIQITPQITSRKGPEIKGPEIE